MTYPDDRLLRHALFANAVFSAACAATMVAGAPSLAGLLGAVDPLALYVIAGGLAVFSVGLFRQTAADPVHPVRALGATVGDLLWVFGSVFLLVLPSDVLSERGSFLVAAAAAVVLSFALLQLLGLKRYARNRSGRTEAPSMYVLRRTLSAPPDRVWSLLRQLDRIGEFYDQLDRVDVEETDAGTVRTCTTAGGQRWREEVLELDGVTKSLTLRFAAEAQDFPFPMTMMVGGWRVEPEQDGSTLTLWYEFAMKGGVLGELSAALIGPFMERRMGPVLEKLGRVAVDETTASESGSAR